MAGEREERTVQVYGLNGRLLATGPESSDLPFGYRVSLQTSTRTDTEIALGPRVQRLFQERFRRAHPWTYFPKDKGDQVLILPRDLRARIDEVSNQESASVSLPIDAEVVNINKALEGERLSPHVATSLETAYLVEALLPDFSKDGLITYRHFDGASDQYFQWTGEEEHHQWMDRGILIATGSRKPQEVDDVKVRILSKEWMAPFKDGIMMAIYAAFQEPVTMDFYFTVARIMERDGAPNAARMLRLVATDEAYHGAWYHTFVEEYAKYDRASTEQQVYQVALLFAMPADAIADHKRERLFALGQVFGESPKLHYAEVLRRVMKSYSFVNRDKADLVADVYAGKVKMEESKLYDMLLAA